MAYKIFFSCCFILLSSVVQAQFIQFMSSDRPGQKLTPMAVGKDYLQFQGGGEIGKRRQSAPGSPIPAAQFSAEHFLLRYGISQKAELNIGFSTEQQTVLNAITVPAGGLRNYRAFDRSPLQGSLGMRYMFFSEEDRDFSLGAVGLFILGKENNSGNLNVPGAKTGLSASKLITGKMLATGNMGIHWNEPLAGHLYYYTIQLGFDLGKNFGLFAEAMNQNSFNAWGDYRQFLNGGFSWKLTPNFMFDVSGGWARTHALAFKEDYFFGGFGVSWKIKTRPSTAQRL